MPLGRRFWALWSASTVSSIGNGLSQVALPLLAVTLTQKPILVAGVLFAQQLPWLIVAIPAGAYSDRADRPALMRAMDVVRGGLFAGLALMVATGTVTLASIYGFGFAVGVCDTFFAGSTQATLPAIVAGPRLADANALLSVGATAGEETVGPAIGGVLFSLSSAVPFGADAVSFFGSAALLLGLGRARRTDDGVPGSPRFRVSARTLWSDTRAGLAWYRASPALRAITATVALLAFSQAMVAGVLVLYVLQRLHLHRVGYGLFMAGVAVGNLAGGATAAPLLRRFGTATVLVAVTLLAAAGYLGAAATSSPYLAGAFLGVEAIGVVVGNVATASFRQRTTPAPLQARVANVWKSIVWGVIPLGALAGGVVGSSLGLRAPFYVAAGLQVILAAAMARPLHRLVDRRGATG